MTVSYAPHINDNATTSRIMLDVVIALCPALIVGIIVFGYNAAIVTAVCVAACVFFEWAYEKLTNRKNTIGDFSAAVTGLLLAYNLPPTVPLWQAIFGCLVAIVFVKQIFGGLGKNFANPAITARIVMFLAFSGPMTTWVMPFTNSMASDAVTGATPLAMIKKDQLDVLPSMSDMFLGLHGSCIGEASELALLIGGIYLLVRRVITWHAPVAFIGTVFVLTIATDVGPMYHLMAGGLFLGAIFMATDYVTTPITNSGRIVFGVGCGLITVLIRLFGSYPEGVSFAILFMNMMVPYINKITMKKALGGLRV